jgi:Family of unknown function (DUF5761)
MSSLVQDWVQSLSDFYTGTAIPNAPKHTGRLPLSDSEEKMSIPRGTLYTMHEPAMIPTLVAEQIQYRHTNTPLNTVFFSEANKANLQQKIHDAVLAASKGEYDIGEQSEADLSLIMRSYYLQYAENDPSEVAAELDKLNQRVVAYASNRIMVEIVAYKRFRKDILDFPEPIERPKDMQIYGTRTGELKSFF